MAFKFKVGQFVAPRDPDGFLGFHGNFSLGQIMARIKNENCPYDVQVIVGDKPGLVVVAKASWMEAVTVEVDLNEVL